MPRYTVLVDCDKRGGDDDVFAVRVHVQAPTEGEARQVAERMCAQKYGEENVLGAYQVDPEKGATQ